MNDSVAKVAVTPKESAPIPEAKNPDRVTETRDSVDSVALYQELKGLPYTADFFDVKEIWDNPKLSLKEDVEAIEEAYRAKVYSGEVKDGVESYEEMVKEAEAATESKNSPPQVRVAKIAAFVRFMNEVDKIDKARRTYA